MSRPISKTRSNISQAWSEKPSATDDTQRSSDKPPTGKQVQNNKGSTRGTLNFDAAKKRKISFSELLCQLFVSNR